MLQVSGAIRRAELGGMQLASCILMSSFVTWSSSHTRCCRREDPASTPQAYAKDTDDCYASTPMQLQ